MTGRLAIGALLILAVGAAPVDARPSLVYWLGADQQHLLQHPDTARSLFSALDIDTVTLGTGCCGDVTSTRTSNLDAAITGLSGSGVRINLVIAHLEIDRELVKYPPYDESGRAIKRGCANCEIPFDIFSEAVQTAYLRVIDTISRRYGNDTRIYGFTLFGPGLMIEWEYYFGSWARPSFPAYSESAHRSFRTFLANKYHTLTALNDRWKMSYSSWSSISVPKPLMHASPGAIDERPEWSDCMDWYRSALLDFLEAAVRTARSNTKKPLLVLFASTYGYLQGKAGVSWGDTVRTISKYGPIAFKSNGTEPMAVAYARQLASFYKVGLWLESPAIRDRDMFDLLLHNALSWRADAVHVNSLTSALTLFRRDVRKLNFYLTAALAKTGGIVPEAPHDIAFFHNATAGFYRLQSARGISDYQNVDLITTYASGPLWSNELNMGEHLRYPPVLDEALIEDGALDSFRALVICNSLPFILPGKTAESIARWITAGGTLVFIKRGYTLDPQGGGLVDFSSFLTRSKIDRRRVIALPHISDIPSALQRL